MVLFLCTGFIILCGVFGVFLTFARPENIERPFMVGVLTTVTSALGGWIVWLQWKSFSPSTGLEIAACLLAVAGFAIGRAVDLAMGAGRLDADERQATLGADLSD